MGSKGSRYTIIFFSVLALFFAGSVDVSADASCTAEAVRWSTSTNRLYISGPVRCSLSDIRAIRGDKSPVNTVSTESGVWLLESNIVLQNGATLILHGTAIGGDVDELRLKSNNEANGIVYIRADWGNVDIRSTKVISWDTIANSVDTEYATYARSFIHVRSRLGGDGVTAFESRMDIIDSEIGYLGHYAAESYGLVWKVSGRGPSDLYDKVDVHGDIINSYIHHNYFGVYTYGAYGMVWRGNEMAYNVEYGFDPHDDSDFLVIENNNVHHNGNHGIICSKRCNDLVIRNNTSFANDGNGIMLHRDANDSLVVGNELYANSDTGIALFEARRNEIIGNNVHGNKRGIRLSVGTEDNLIEDNQFIGNISEGIFFYRGSDVPVRGDGRPKNNLFVGNTVADNGKYAMKLKESDYNRFEDNVFSGDGKGVYVYSGSPVGNVFARNVFEYDGGASYALKMIGTSKSLIEENSFVGAKDTVYIIQSHGIEVVDNDITYSTQYGIRLRDTHDSVVAANEVHDGRRGIYLHEGSSGNIIEDNEVHDNTSYAIYAYRAGTNEYDDNVMSGNGRDEVYVKN